jgi:trehalose-6-phosphatase
VVYVGDDVTDEDVFRALASRAITVKVGYDRDSSASYWSGMNSRS